MLPLLTEAISGYGDQHAEYLMEGDVIDYSIQAIEHRLMQEVFHHGPVIGSDESLDGIKRGRSRKETFDKCHDSQHNVRSIAVKGTQFNATAQPYPWEQCRQMELPVCQ